LEAASSSFQTPEMVRKNVDIRHRSYKRALRLASGSAMTMETPRDVTAKVILSNPFDYLASLGSQTAYFNDLELTGSPWFTKLQHRSLITIVLGALCSKEVGGGEVSGVTKGQSSDYFAFSATRLHDTIEQIQRVHPEEEHADSMMEIDFILATIGMTFHVTLEKRSGKDT